MPAVTWTPDMAGRWTIRWTSSGTGTIGAYTDVVNVWPQDPKFIISLDDAKQALGMADVVDPVRVDEIRLHIAAATPVIESIAGPVLPGTKTVEVPPYWSYADLDGYTPGSALTVTYKDNGSTVDTSAYKTDDANVGGLLYLRPSARVILISYPVGSPVVPPNIQLATRELVRHWWQLGRQAGRASVPGGFDEAAPTPSGFAVPKRVVELCLGNAVGGFA